MYRSVAILKKALRRPKLSPLVDLEPLHKQEVKPKAELYTAWQKVKGMTQNAP